MRLQAVLLTIASILVGVAIGISGFTFVYAKGDSYFRDQPEACANCHAMREQFDGWTHSSHHKAAGCNDCHTPKAAASKYINKFLNGLRHSWAFTMGRFHEPITIKAHNRAILESRCRDCHPDIIDAIDSHHNEKAELTCTGCHGSVGHFGLVSRHLD